MSEPYEIPRPSQLWKSLDPERKLKASAAFWKDDNAALEQAEALAMIAQRLKFRPKSVIGLAIDKKTRQLATIGVVSELVAARLLVAYHLEHQRPMMGAFLDALGIPHEQGMIADEALTAPAADVLRGAVTAIANAYPAEDVALYLSTLQWQDAETWGPLADAPESRVPARA
jgi:alkylhydroperoxidase/carboxymuconolactone decarboxylase family protein YurZ